MNSIWLITSELANQRARKVLFTCVVSTNIIDFIILNIHFQLVESRSKKVRVISFISSSSQLALNAISRKGSFRLVYFFSALIVFEIVRFFPHHKPGGHRFSKASNDDFSSFSSSSAAFSSVMALFFPHHRPGGQHFSKTSISGPCFLGSSALDSVILDFLRVRKAKTIKWDLDTKALVAWALEDERRPRYQRQRRHGHSHAHTFVLRFSHSFREKERTARSL